MFVIVDRHVVALEDQGGGVVGRAVGDNLAVASDVMPGDGEVATDDLGPIAPHRRL